MTKRPRTAPKSKAWELAEILGVKLLPWQETELNAYLYGNPLYVHVGGRQGGRSTVKALADLVDALRTPPVPPAFAALDEALPWITEPSIVLPSMLPPDRAPAFRFPHMPYAHSRTAEGATHA